VPPANLRDILKRIKDASLELGRRDLTPCQKAEIEKLETSFIQRDEPPPTRWRSAIWKTGRFLVAQSRAERLVATGADLQGRTSGRRRWNPCSQPSMLALPSRPGADCRLGRDRNLLNEIESSTSRISDLVRAIKEYTYMDQAPVQKCRYRESLETTLTILNHKLKRGVAVQRDYQRIPLLVNSFGSELNQVWTNLIDNAIDAMEGKASFACEPIATTDALWLRSG